ncbi:hypothetical protein MNV49_003229 [Pseudohyphozyma bogoriensis]|nr:hypothetical protein MNV49_003229 [Pseudohyphozyma bogoriensis]
MSTYLKNGSQLRSSQYKKLTAVLGHLEGLLPYAQLADDLALPGARPPRVETDPVANSLNLSHNALTTPEGNDDAIDSLRAQLEDLLAKFQTPAIVSATGVTVERVSGKDRRLGKKDEFGRVYAVGRRKESTAQVWIIPTPPSASPDDAVPGQVLVNARPLPDYFGTLPHREVVVRPLVLTSALGSFNVFAIVKGGGSAAQADAVAMGMARALAEWARCEEEEGRFTSTTEHWRDWLNAAKLLKRDPRVVERKKTGQPKARKKNTWVKR